MCLLDLSLQYSEQSTYTIRVRSYGCCQVSVPALLRLSYWFLDCHAVWLAGITGSKS